MIKNYLKTAWRNLWKNKAYSFITISGLSLAMGGAILLLLWIQNAVSTDKFHTKGDFLYKVYQKATTNGYVDCWDVTPAPLGPILLKDYQEIMQMTRVIGSNKLLSKSDKKIMANGNIVDPSFLRMFSFPLVKGNIQNVLNDNHSIVITEKLAGKLFSGGDAINRSILVDTNMYTITGILKDLPGNTQFDFEFLLPWRNEDKVRIEDQSWTIDQAATYVELKPLTRKEFLDKKITDVLSSYSKNDIHARIFLYPFSKTWLYGQFNNGKPAGGLIDIVHIFFLVAFILLLIGCINFMNLSTARSESRAKEIGVRKVAGARRSDLIIQFIAESILISFIAGIIALLLAQLALPSFNTLTEKHLSISYISIYFWLAALGFIFFTGILAGCYPALYLSSIKTTNALKRLTKNNFAMFMPRKILVVLQLVFSIVMINYSCVIIRQTRYMKNRDTGFLKNDLIFHQLTSDLQKNFLLVKKEILNNSKIIAVNKTNTLITSGSMETNDLQWNGNKVNPNFQLITSNADFVVTNGLVLDAGRDLDLNVFPTDTSSCLINETALRMVGNKSGIGQVFTENGTDCTVVGVLKDFVNDYPGHEVRPLLVRASNNANFMNIRLHRKTSISDLGYIKRVIKKYNPSFITEIQYAADDYDKKFKGAEVSLTLAVGFTILAIFISCSGLFGLATFMVTSRTKEIGIRKVLGASIFSIIYLLNRDFVKLIFIAVLIGCPIAWLIMQSSIQNFSYRISSSWLILVQTSVLSIFIVLLTVTLQTQRAARANFIKSLKSD